jgi:hypothetical protein
MRVHLNSLRDVADHEDNDHESIFEGDQGDKPFVARPRGLAEQAAALTNTLGFPVTLRLPKDSRSGMVCGEIPHTAPLVAA